MIGFVLTPWMAPNARASSNLPNFSERSSDRVISRVIFDIACTFLWLLRFVVDEPDNRRTVMPVNMKLRPYQLDMKQRIYDAWNAGITNVGSVMPTGSGKTVLLASIAHEYNQACCAIAHRQELVGQISVAFAREGLRHRIFAPRPTIKMIVNKHMKEVGQSWYDPRSPIAVAGVRTLVRAKNLGPWANQVGLWIQDECHHILQGNDWGKAALMFPNARGLGVTATPCRADGKGLGSTSDGVLDTLLVGPTMRELIDQGHLCDYRIFAERCKDLDISHIELGADGDFKKKQVQAAVEKSHIVGDIVTHYLRHAAGKRGVTFVNSVDTATRVAAQYNSQGVPAEVVSAKTPDNIRAAHIDRFSRGELLQLVNVDLFGEGFDLPAIECVSFARLTASYALYVQQFGRALRILEGKDKAIIIDHVGNVVRHGLPDAARGWSLERRQKRSRKKPSDDIPLTACPECANVYEKIHSACPYCGHKPEPVSRSAPEEVEGDLVELDPAVLAKMRGDADRIMGEPRVPQHLPPVAQAGARKQHEERRQSQLSLRASTEQWLGYRRAEGRTTSQSQRLFFFRFGTDMMTAQTLGRPEAVRLANSVNRDIGASHVEYAGAHG